MDECGAEVDWERNPEETRIGACPSAMPSTGNPGLNWEKGSSLECNCQNFERH
jgi:hypothetical protein